MDQYCKRMLMYVKYMQKMAEHVRVTRLLMVHRYLVCYVCQSACGWSVL